MTRFQRARQLWRTGALVHWAAAVVLSGIVARFARNSCLAIPPRDPDRRWMASGKRRLTIVGIRVGIPTIVSLLIPDTDSEESGTEKRGVLVDHCLLSLLVTIRMTPNCISGLIRRHFIGYTCWPNRLGSEDVLRPAGSRRRSGIDSW